MRVLVQKVEGKKTGFRYYGDITHLQNKLFLDNEHYDLDIAPETLNIEDIQNVSVDNGIVSFQHNNANYEITDYTGEGLTNLEERLMVG
jgi:hypothetical protein